MRMEGLLSYVSRTGKKQVRWAGMSEYEETLVTEKVKVVHDDYTREGG